MMQAFGVVETLTPTRRRPGAADNGGPTRLMKPTKLSVAPAAKQESASAPESIRSQSVAAPVEIPTAVAKPRVARRLARPADDRSEEHTSELQSRQYLVCR